MPIEGNATDWQQLMGFAGQGMISAALKNMGYKVSDEEKTVHYNKFTGHIDGKLSDGDFGDKRAIWDAKVFSAFRYRQLLKGLPEGDGGIYLQQQIYIAAESADYGLVTVAPSDLSTNRSLMAQYKVEGDPRINPILITPDNEALDIANSRADMIDFAVQNMITPQREFNPERGKFPCTFCSFKNFCVLEGDTSYVVTPLPESYGR